MKLNTIFSVLAVCALAVFATACTTTSFFGSNDPCTIGAGIHTAFVTVVAPRVSADARRGERAAYAGFSQACASGDITKPTLRQLLDAYSAAVEEYKKE